MAQASAEIQQDKVLFLIKYFEKLKVFKDYFRQILKSFGCLNRPEFISVLTIQRRFISKLKINE